MGLVLVPLIPTTHPTPTSQLGKYIQAILNVQMQSCQSTNRLSIDKQALNTWIYCDHTTTIKYDLEEQQKILM